MYDKVLFTETLPKLSFLKLGALEKKNKLGLFAQF